MVVYLKSCYSKDFIFHSTPSLYYRIVNNLRIEDTIDLHYLKIIYAKYSPLHHGESEARAYTIFANTAYYFIGEDMNKESKYSIRYFHNFTIFFFLFGSPAILSFLS